MEDSTQEWYRPGESIASFHASQAYVRGLVGGRGSGKSTGVSVEVSRHCWHNAGAKVMLVRKTETSQADSTIETFLQTFAKLGNLYTDTGDGLFKIWDNGRTIRLPSDKAVKAFNAAAPTWKTKGERIQWLDTEGTRLCGFVEMRGVPNDKDSEIRFRGFECSMMVLVEADQLTKKDFNLAMACLRWKGSDPDTCDENGFILDAGLILDTNPPSPSHWIAQLEADKKQMEMLNAEFWHIPTHENVHNLPPNYIERQIMIPYANNPAMIERMLYGRYADAYDGNAVYYAFNAAEHAGEDLPWPKGAYMIRGWDFGTHNSVVWSAYWIENGVEYWHDMAEQFLESSDTERQAVEALKLTEQDFPFWNNRDVCAGVMDYCDPAGKNSSYLVSDKRLRDPIHVLQTFGIHPGYKTSPAQRGLQVSIAIVSRLMSRKDKDGRPVYRIDKKNCPMLYRGLCGGYRYPKQGEPGFGNNQPLKGALCEHLDHIQDAARYGKINALRLLDEEVERINAANHTRSRRNPNPAKLI